MRNVLKVKLSFKNPLAWDFAVLLAVTTLFSGGRWVEVSNDFTQSEVKENQFCIFVCSLEGFPILIECMFISQ
jgi:hypothetical protein